MTMMGVLKAEQAGRAVWSSLGRSSCVHNATLIKKKVVKSVLSPLAILVRSP